MSRLFLLVLGVFYTLPTQAELAYAPSEKAAITENITLPKPSKHYSQESRFTCWAACAVMVHHYNGQKIKEQDVKDLVANIVGRNETNNVEATKRQCLIALAQRGGGFEDLKKGLLDILNTEQTSINWNPAEHAKAIYVTHNKTKSLDTLVAALKKGEPVVIVCKKQLGDGEHATFVRGAALGKVEGATEVGLVHLQVFDPADSKERIVTLPSEFLQKNLEYILTKTIAIDYFTAEKKALKTESKGSSGASEAVSFFKRVIGK